MASAEINIIKIDGKPLEKLIEVVSRGIGRLYHSREIRRLADAEAYRVKTLAQAQAEANAGTSLARATVEHFVQARINHIEVARQLNIENVVYGAAEELREEPDVTNEPVDDDWINRFFNIAKDISNEEMQAIWSKILAGEVKQPNSYSLRTLELLRNLSANDARAFQAIAQFVIKLGGFSYVYYKNIAKQISEIGLTYPSFLHLIDLGILSSNDAQYALEERNLQVFKHGHALVQVFVPEGKFAFTMTPFTAVGNELLALVQKEFNERYFRLVCEDLNRIHPTKHRKILINIPPMAAQTIESYLGVEPAP